MIITGMCSEEVVGTRVRILGKIRELPGTMRGDEG